MFKILVVQDVVEFLPHVSVFGSGELYFNIHFLLAICSHDGFLEGIAALLIIIHSTRIKGYVSSVESRANISVNPRFLIHWIQLGKYPSQCNKNSPVT